MNALGTFATATARSVLRWTRRAGAILLGLAASLVAGFTLYATTTLPDLAPWHTTILPGEFSARGNAPRDFQGYQELEKQLFAAAGAAAWDPQSDGYASSRFNPAGNPQRLVEGAPYNRSFRLTPAVPVGGALLVHGLTDSPYSMKALAETLHRQGFEVTVLRLPGHGTWPSMLTRMKFEDWVAAVRLAARDVAERTPPGRPFYVGGYSTGGTLMLSYTLDSLRDPALRRPDRVLLVSPAIEISPLAPLANLLDLLAVLPVDEVQKVRWQSVLPEFDPYKFNSFPVNATRQVNGAVNALQARLDAAASDGRLGDLPPVVTWQSAIDSTVGSRGAVNGLYGRLGQARHRLVVFDTNRLPRWKIIAHPGPRALVAQATAGRRGYTLELVSNDGTDSPQVTLRRYTPGASVPEVLPTDLAWPEGTVSVGHVALPFPPDDPLYGYLPGSGRNGVPSLGSLLLRGEPGATTIALGSLTRPRSNPFWPLIDRQVAELVATDLAGNDAQPQATAPAPVPGSP
ncbi:MAG: alpha/beta hydrolase [Chromatiales bacterium]|jgi:alpha-beta hydrolase superfamily lysophospholipase|nr:alpha/beta hydrolase [Chromatiales bacterium]